MFVRFSERQAAQPERTKGRDCRIEQDIAAPDRLDCEPVHTRNGEAAMRRGVMYGMMAGALWGTVFLVPRLLADFSPALLASARCMMYGIVSLAAAVPIARRIAAKLTRADLVALARLAFIGNLVYYVFLTAAVHHVGIGPTSLIVGVLPVTVTLAGRRDHGAVPLGRLIWPLALVMAGIVCINVDVFANAPAPTPDAQSVPGKLLGLVCALGALASWTWFAVENARTLRRLNAHETKFDSNEWSVLLGILTGLFGAMLWFPASALTDGPGGIANAGAIAAAGAGDARWQIFWLLNLGLAVGASWLGNGLWNAAATRLPLTLSGQMIVFETLFALLYGFIYDSRLPRPLEAAAILLLLAGVVWAVRRHSGEQAGKRPEQDVTVLDAHQAHEAASPSREEARSPSA
ncbi:EamA family transporter [Trinickia symbiotica]|uniref:EamA family transporter n=2 Tax=Trinickia symbiotica TaxID=863227 RepID=A0A2T3XTY2_9BURK|nr:EamA family transporter [Trinickia symbiotica]